MVDAPETCDPPGDVVGNEVCRSDCTYCGGGIVDGMGGFGVQQVISKAADRATAVFAEDVDGDLDVLSASWLDNEIAWYRYGGPDGVADLCDNCPDVVNSDQADADNDGLGTPAIRDPRVCFLHLLEDQLRADDDDSIAVPESDRISVGMTELEVGCARYSLAFSKVSFAWSAAAIPRNQGRSRP